MIFVHQIICIRIKLRCCGSWLHYPQKVTFINSSFVISNRSIRLKHSCHLQRMQKMVFKMQVVFFKQSTLQQHLFTACFHHTIFFRFNDMLHTTLRIYSTAQYSETSSHPSALSHTIDCMSHIHGYDCTGWHFSRSASLQSQFHSPCSVYVDHTSNEAPMADYKNVTGR